MIDVLYSSGKKDLRGLSQGKSQLPEKNGFLLESIKDHPEANTFSRLIVALMEAPQGLTLEEAAKRFEQGGVADYATSLKALRSCRPARAPIYKHNNRYVLDLHDRELAFYLWRLDFTSQSFPTRLEKQNDTKNDKLPGVGVKLSKDELREAFQDASLGSWSGKRIALAVLDAHDNAIHPDQLLKVLSDLNCKHRLKSSLNSSRKNSNSLTVLPDGRWEIKGFGDLLATRGAVRGRIEKLRSSNYALSVPQVSMARTQISRDLEESRSELTRTMKKAIIRAFPEQSPKILSVLDIDSDRITHFDHGSFPKALDLLDSYGFIAGVQIRQILQKVGLSTQGKVLADLSPSQKTKKLIGQNKKTKLTTEFLIESSLGLQPQNSDTVNLASKATSGNLNGQEASLRGLKLLYEYGCLHGCVRVGEETNQDSIRAPWADKAEGMFSKTLREAHIAGKYLQVVLDKIEDPNDPWKKSMLIKPEQHPHLKDYFLKDPQTGERVPELKVKLVRMIPAM